MLFSKKNSSQLRGPCFIIESQMCGTDAFLFLHVVCFEILGFLLTRSVSNLIFSASGQLKTIILLDQVIL